MIDFNPVDRTIVQHDINDNWYYGCEHTNKEPRKKTDKIGRPFFVWQCLDCGRGVGTVRKTDVLPSPAEDIKDYDEDLDEEKFKKFQDGQNEARRERKAQFDAWYVEYRSSDKWREKRDAVMFRSRGVCEGCRKAKADIVHHLTYDHVGDELLYELVALCNNCHDKAHGRG